MGMTVEEAGRKGGLALLRNRGRAHFVQLGKKGQLTMRRKDTGMAHEWGQRGGRPRKPKLAVEQLRLAALNATKERALRQTMLPDHEEAASEG